MFDPQSEAVFGNGGGVQVQNTMNQSLIPTTDKFKVVSNIDILNSWQGTILHDDFVNTDYQTELPVFFNHDLTKGRLVFEYNLFGYTNVKHMFLQLDLIGNGTPLVANADTYVQTSMAFLQNITKCKIQLGNNLLVLGNEIVQDTAGINFTSIEGAISPTERDIISALGQSRTKISLDAVQAEEKGAYLNGADLDTFAKQYNQKMSFLLQLFYNVNTDVVKRVNIPLWLLNPFFKRDDTFLPQGLPIRISIDFMTSYFAKYQASVPYYRTTLGIAPVTGTGTTYQRPAIDFAINNTSNPKIVYMYNTLKEESSRKYIQMWGNRPLLYNSFTYGRSEFVMKSDKHVDELFMINQSLPLEIFLCVQYKVDINNNGFDNISTGSKLEPVAGNYLNLLNANAGCIFSNIKVWANGILLRDIPGYIQSTTLLNIPKVVYGKSAEEIISDINHAEQVYEGPRQTIINSSSMFNRNSSAPFKIILAAGDIYNIHKYPIDKGTIQLRVAFDVVNSTGNTFNKNYSSIVYYKHPSQLLINDRFTCVSVNWPAISNGSYEFISPTFGSN